ncbi:hypothetical protein [Microbacterium luticocti]|uniref:hypothetical protein n=1 Tax=Microbacterium luticocti TaxID=451764 RepID=UPI00048AE08D|nr:hypothetical protein [Microbacterium luticocti]
MARLQADAPADRWVPVTGSLGLRGRRQRKAAIRMLLTQANGALGRRLIPGGRVFAWLLSQAAPVLMRKADGRVLVWMWKDDPELVVAMAVLQKVTPQQRAAQAMKRTEFDGAEQFRSPHLGVGERLVVPLPAEPDAPPFAAYTWDVGMHVVTLTAVCGDRSRFGTVTAALDDLARSLRITDDVRLNESTVLRLDPPH